MSDGGLTDKEIQYLVAMVTYLLEKKGFDDPAEALDATLEAGPPERPLTDAERQAVLDKFA